MILYIVYQSSALLTLISYEATTDDCFAQQYLRTISWTCAAQELVTLCVRVKMVRRFRNMRAFREALMRVGCEQLKISEIISWLQIVKGRGVRSLCDSVI